MFDSFKLCLTSRFGRSRKLLPKLNFPKNFSIFRTRKTETFISSELSWSISSFTTMEISTQFKQVFKLMDGNGDGKISPLELKQVLVCLGHEKTIAAEEAEGMVKEMDSDGDGFVSLDEFMSVMGSDQNEVSADGICEGSGVLEAFRVFDADNDGLISAKELQRVLRRMGCVKFSLEECRKMIKGVDRDGDEFVNFEDFKTMMTSGS